MQSVIRIGEVSKVNYDKGTIEVAYKDRDLSLIHISLAGTYTGGVFTYTNQRKKVNINVTVGSGDRMLKLTQYASSEADAKRQLEAAIAMKNHSNTTVSFKTMGDLNIHATQCVNIQGYGKMDGKYYLCLLYTSRCV